MLNKTCTICKTNKSMDKFYYRKDRNRYRYTSSCKSCHRDKINKNRNTPLGKYKAYKYSALKRNLKFDLSYEEFLSFNKLPCHYCGTTPDSISLDRLDNDSGYYLENVASCCYICNSIKHVYEEKDFLKHVEKIYLYQQKVKHDKQESSC